MGFRLTEAGDPKYGVLVYRMHRLARAVERRSQSENPTVGLTPRGNVAARSTAWASGRRLAVFKQGQLELLVNC